jgi:hypothetical protein
VRKLGSDVDSLQSQVEGFYKTQIRELFGGHRNEGRYMLVGDGTWTVILKKQPILASLRFGVGRLNSISETIDWLMAIAHSEALPG